MITVDVKNRFTGQFKRRYLCKELYVVNRLKRKYKFWLRVDVTDWR